MANATGRLLSRCVQVLALCSAMGSWALAFPLGVAGAPTAIPAATAIPSAARPGVLDQDIRALLDYGRLMRQCFLFDFAGPLYQHAVDLAPNIANQDLRLRASAEAAIFHLRLRNDGAAIPLAEQVQAALETAGDADSRCVGHLALAYRWATAGNEASFRAEIQYAERLARSPRLAAECAMALSEGLLGFRNPVEALPAAQSALEAFENAGDIMGQSEAHTLLGTCLRGLGKDGPASLEARKAITLTTSTRVAPFLNPETTYPLAESLLENHAAAARNGQYREAMHDILSLLILKRYQHRLKTQQGASLGLKEGELLAYLALYVLEQGHPLPGQVFLALSDNAVQQGLNLHSRARCRWIAGRFWRRAGNPAKALEILGKAEDYAFGDPDPELLIHVLEEQGLAHLQLRQRDEASKAIQQAFDEAAANNRSADMARLQAYKDSIAKGQTRIEQMPARQAAPPDKPLAAAIPLPKPGIFDSPFLADYPAGSRQSAADAMAALTYDRLDPTPAPVNLTPELLMESGVYDQAAAQLRRILRKEGKSARRLMQLGICHYQMRQWEEAREALEESLRLDPKNGPAQIYLKNVRQHLQNRPAVAPGE